MHEDIWGSITYFKKWKKIKGRRIGELLSEKWYFLIAEDSVDIKKDKYEGCEATWQNI